MLERDVLARRQRRARGWLAITGAVHLLMRSWQQPRYWPVWALTSALGTAIVVAVDGPGWALLGPSIVVLVTWAGRQVLLRPVGTDLAGQGWRSRCAEATTHCSCSGTGSCSS